MPAGLRAIQTKDQEVLNPRDLLAISERQKAAEAQAKANRQEQRLADLEGVDNDLKVPFYRNQISSLTKQYQEYVTSPDYDPIKASRMKDAILNAKQNLGEIDNNIAAKIAENPDSFGVYADEVFGMFDGSTTLPQSPEAIDFSLNALNYANIDKKNALEYRSKVEPQIDAYLKAKAEKEGRTYTIGNRKFVEKVAFLSEDEKNEIATEAANNPQFLKHLQDDIFGREITEEEAEAAAYEELFSLLPTSTRRTEAGTMPKENSYGDGGRFNDIDLDLTPTEVKVPFNDAKDTGVEKVKSIQFPNIDRISNVEYQVEVLPYPDKEESDSNKRYSTEGELVRLDVGKSGENIGKPVGVFSVGRREGGAYITQEVEVPYEEIRGEVVNGINTKYAKKEDRNGALNLLKKWENKVESESLTEDYNEDYYQDIYDGLFKIATSNKSKKEKTEAFKEYFPQGTDVKYIGGTNDISVNGEELKLFTGGILRDLSKVSDAEDIIKTIYSVGASLPEERQGGILD